MNKNTNLETPKNTVLQPISPITGDAITPMILGFDPGRDKCGLAVMGSDHMLHWHKVLASGQVIESIYTLFKTYPISLLVMGNQTTSEEWYQLLQSKFPSTRMIKVDERYSSLEARNKYWQMYPPKGLEALIPQSLRTINCPIDDIVAMILIERYLDKHHRCLRIDSPKSL